MLFSPKQRFPLVLFLNLFVQSVFADTLSLKDGTTHSGTITKITDSTVILMAPHASIVFQRALLVEILFSKSDRVILTSGATLQGKVLRREGSGILIALENGLKILPQTQIAEFLFYSGGPFRPAELSRTDEVFQFEPQVTTKVRFPYFFSGVLTPRHLLYKWGSLSTQSEKILNGLAYGVEFGFDLNNLLAFAVGGEWFKPQTDVVQALKHEDRGIGYSSGYIAMSAKISPRALPALGFSARLQLFLTTATDYTYVTGNESGDFDGSLAIKVGAQYALTPGIEPFCEVGFQEGKLGSQFQSSRFKGTVLSFGLKVHPFPSASN